MEFFEMNFDDSFVATGLTEPMRYSCRPGGCKTHFDTNFPNGGWEPAKPGELGPSAAAVQAPQSKSVQNISAKKSVR